MLTNSIAVWLAVETSQGQVELELAPAVEIPNAWSKKARWPRWPRCLTRWPSRDRVGCIKVLVDWAPAHQISDAHSLTNLNISDCQLCQKENWGFTRSAVLKVWAPGPAVACENLLEMQIPRTRSGPTE